MPATKINPFQLWEPLGKLFLDMYQGALEDICPTLAMTMTVETFYVVGQLIGQQIGCNAKTTSGSTWIIKQRTHFGISRIDTQTTTDLRIYLPHPLMITGVLRQGIERKMAGAPSYLVNNVFQSMFQLLFLCQRSKFFLLKHQRQKLIDYLAIRHLTLLSCMAKQNQLVLHVHQSL